jgi:hypothetical protein
VTFFSRHMELLTGFSIKEFFFNIGSLPPDPISPSNHIHFGESSFNPSG